MKETFQNVIQEKEKYFHVQYFSKIRERPGCLIKFCSYDTPTGFLYQHRQKFAISTVWTRYNLSMNSLR